MAGAAPAAMRRAKNSEPSGRLAAATLLALATLSACTAAAPRRPVVTPVGTAPSTARIVAVLERRDEDLSRFRAQARLAYQSSTQSFKSTQVVAVRAPSSLRIDVMNPFGVSYTVATDGVLLSAFDRRERIFYAGKASTDSFRRFLGVPIGAAELASLVRGLPPDLGEARSSTVEATEGGWLWRRGFKGGATLELLLDSTTLEPLWASLAGYRDHPDVEADFLEYRDVAGVRVAHRIEVRFADGSHLELNYKSVQRDVKLPPDAFRLERPAGSRFVDVEAEDARGA